MACPVTVTSVDVLDNPSSFLNPLQFEIQYECNEKLEKDLEWRLTYVGNAESEEYDQVLDSVLVGPVFPGQYRFVFQADPPDSSRIPHEDILGITAVLLTCSYNEQEFVRVGYYVNNEYPENEEALRLEPPKVPILERLVRNILADKPRVTKFPIAFDEPAGELPVAGDAMVSTPGASTSGFGGQQQQQLQGQQPGGFGEQHAPGGAFGFGQQQQQGGGGGFGGGQLAGQFAAAAMQSPMDPGDGMQEEVPQPMHILGLQPTEMMA